MEVQLLNQKFRISKKQEKEYEKLFDFADFDYKKMWSFDTVLPITVEEIFVLCHRFLFRYIQDKSMGRIDGDEISAWRLFKEKKTFEKIKNGRSPVNLNEALLLLGTISNSIMVRKKIPKIKKSSTIFGNSKELIKLSRMLFYRANSIIKKQALGNTKSKGLT